MESTAQALFQGVDDVLAKAVFNGTTVLRWDLITIKQTSAKETQLKQGPQRKTLQLKSHNAHVILHNTAMKASSAFAKFTKFDIENHCVDPNY